MTKYCTCHEKWHCNSSCGHKRQVSRRGACHQTCYSVLQSTTPYYKALLQYYSALQSPTPYYKVLLQSTTPVPLFTTKYNSSTTLHYSSTTPHQTLCSGYLPKFQPMLRLPRKVTLQHHQIMRLALATRSDTPTWPNIAPATKSDTVTVPAVTRDKCRDVAPATKRATLYYKVLLRTTKHYSSTTLYYKVLLRTTKYYYKVLLQYHFLLQSTTPVLLCTTPVLLLTKHCAPAIYPNFNQCCACPEKWHSNITK